MRDETDPEQENSEKSVEEERRKKEEEANYKEGVGEVSGPRDPPWRLHKTSQVRCVSEEGEKRIVVYESGDSGRWIDIAEDYVVETERVR